METEAWKPVLGFEGCYEVSNLGRVRSTNRVIKRVVRQGVLSINRKGRVLKPQPDGDGYLKVSLGRLNQRRIGRLVAEAFIPNPDRLPEVDHRDTNKQNNTAINLRWCTKSMNAAYRHSNGCRTYKRRYNDETCCEVVVAVFEGASIMHVASAFGMSRSQVRRISYGC